jgi:hypothetical protein
MNENRNKNRPTIRFLISGLIGILFLLLLTGSIYLATRDNTLGTDFFIYYTAGRNMTVNHGSPYSETVGEQSQMAILKHPARENEDQLRFVYPPYSLIPIFPLAGLPFPWAQAIWMALTLVSIPAAVLYGFPKTSPWFVVSLFFIFPMTFGLLLGNLNMPVICILFLLFGRLPQLEKQDRIESIMLGILMAWTTIKPQFSWFYLLLFLLLALKKSNYSFFSGFLAGGIGFILFSFLLLPDWIPQWIGLLSRYSSFTGQKIPITPLAVWMSPSSPQYVYLGFFILFLPVTVLFFKRWWKNKLSFITLLGWGGFVAFFFHPTGVSYEEMIFILPFILWILQGWKHKPVRFGMFWLLAIAISWVFLYLSVSQIWPAATYYGLFLLYFLWVLFGMFLPPRFLERKSDA